MFSLRIPLLCMATCCTLACSHAPQFAECGNGRKIPLHPSMTLVREDSISSPLMGPGSKFHVRVYRSDQSVDNLVKFFESSLPNAQKASSDIGKEVEFIDLPAGAKDETPQDASIKIRPAEKGGGSSIQIDEVVDPPK